MYFLICNNRNYSVVNFDLHTFGSFVIIHKIAALVTNFSYYEDTIFVAVFLIEASNHLESFLYCQTYASLVKLGFKGSCYLF